MISSIFLLILIIFVSAYQYLKYKLSYWERKGVPHIKPELLYGNAKGIGKTKHLSAAILEFYTELKKQGKFGGIYLPWHPLLMVTDLDLLRHIFIKDFEYFPNRGLYYNEKDDFLSANLIKIEDERWKNLRNKLSPTFTSGKLKMMFQIIQNVAESLVTHLEDLRMKSDEIDIKDVLDKFVVDIIGTCAFGIECNSLADPESEFYKIRNRYVAQHNFFQRFLRNSFPNLAKKLHVITTPPDIAQFYESIVRNTIEYREKNQVIRQDFMNLLIQMKNSQREDHLTFKEVAAQCFAFFTAGHESLATTATFATYELSVNMEIQKKLRNHIKEILKKHNGDICYDSVSEMNYLDQVVSETLRKYPTASAIERLVKFDYKIPGTDIVFEKGNRINIPIYGVHHDPEYYPNPSVFDPDRFTQEEVAKRHPFAYIPFGEGPRICIGMRFGLLTAKIALIKLLMNYEFELDKTKTDVPVKFSIKKLLVQPDKGVFLKMKRI